MTTRQQNDFERFTLYHEALAQRQADFAEKCTPPLGVLALTPFIALGLDTPRSQSIEQPVALTEMAPVEIRRSVGAYAVIGAGQSQNLPDMSAPEVFTGYYAQPGYELAA